MAWSPAYSVAHPRLRHHHPQHHRLGSAARVHRAPDARGSVDILYANAGGLQPATADLSNIAASPFGIVLEYSVQGNDTLVFADALSRAGLRGLWDVRTAASWSDLSVLDKLDAHPATYGFYISEEPSERAPVQAVHDLVGARKHPLVGATFAFDHYVLGDNIRPLLGLCDIITCACYPVGVNLYGDDTNLPLSNVGDVAKAMSVSAQRHNFTPALTLQAFSWDQDPTMAMTPDFARWPTRSEMTAMRNYALDGGIQNLFWFTRWAVTRAYNPDQRWADVCAAAGGRS